MLCADVSFVTTILFFAIEFLVTRLQVSFWPLVRMLPNSRSDRKLVLDAWWTVAALAVTAEPDLSNTVTVE